MEDVVLCILKPELQIVLISPESIRVFFDMVAPADSRIDQSLL
jgi:hypothetical protein